MCDRQAFSKYSRYYNIKISGPDGVALSYQLPVSLLGANGQLNPVGLQSDAKACLDELIRPCLQTKRSRLSGGAVAYLA